MYPVGELERKDEKMACLSPVSFPHPKGMGRVLAPCGQCRACLIDKVMDWYVRINEELKKAKNAFFLTLTYDEENLYEVNGVPSLNIQHVQKFIRNLRDYYRYINLKGGYILDFKPNVRYVITGEYGDKFERPHYHLIIFNCPAFIHESVPEKARNVRPPVNEIFQYVWKYGKIHVGEVNKSTIQYVAKYVFKKSEYPEGVQEPFRLMSLKPAIGAQYLDLYREYHQVGQNYHYNEYGKKSRLPRYYKDKIFTKGQKKALSERALKEAEKIEHNQIARNPNFFIDKFHRNYQDDEAFKLKIDKRKNKKL